MAIEIKPYEPSPLEQQKQVLADALRAAVMEMMTTIGSMN